jgi:hypothetical protein
MDSDRLRPQRRQGYRQPLERRLDNWIQTGRQVVDGVAGNRPGMKKGNSSRSAVNSVEKVGRWVGDKLDWFLEDEDGWLEPWQAANQETDEETYSTSKRALDAVSLRVAPSVSSSVEHSQGSLDDEEWPEESSFRVDRWERNEPVNDDVNFQSLPNKRREPSRSARRPLPRSSRRRF